MTCPKALVYCPFTQYGCELSKQVVIHFFDEMKHRPFLLFLVLSIYISELEKYMYNYISSICKKSKLCPCALCFSILMFSLLQ